MSSLRKCYRSVLGSLHDVRHCPRHILTHLLDSNSKHCDTQKISKMTLFLLFLYSEMWNLWNYTWQTYNSPELNTLAMAAHFLYQSNNNQNKNHAKNPRLSRKSILKIKDAEVKNRRQLIGILSWHFCKMPMLENQILIEKFQTDIILTRFSQ